MTPPKRYAAALLGLIALLGPALPARAQAVDFSGVVVFGDSLSDVGNTANNVFAQLADLFDVGSLDAVINGRFSNGPVWVEPLSARLGLPGSASSRSDAGGDNYAHGGARTGNGSRTLGVIDDIGRQVSDYISSNTPAGNELLILWGGGNNFFDGVGTPASVSADMASYVSALAGDGAQRFLIMNLPRLGEVPRHRGTSTQATLNSQSTAFNDALAIEMAALETSLNIDITLFDVESTFDRLLAEPGTFGFTNTTDPAFDNPAATDPDQYVFWDEIHPTAAAHAVLADAAFVALHDPGDFTGNGVVDADDLEVVLTRFDRPTTPFNLAEGDWDGDGLVGMTEVDLVLANWTQSAVVPAVNVPEPTSAALLLVIGAGCCGRCHMAGRTRRLAGDG